MIESSKRTQLIRRAVISSISGKGISICVQLGAIPLAIGALGLERFGLFSMLSASFLAINIFSVVIGFALTLRVVEANALGDQRTEAMFFSTAFYFAVGGAVILLTVLQLAIPHLNISSLLGLRVQEYENDLYRTAILLSILLSINIVAGLSESVRSGHQEQYINNVFTIVGNIFTLSILIFVCIYPSIFLLSVAIFLPSMALKVLNMLFLFRTHSYLKPEFKKINLNGLIKILSIGASSVLMQVGGFIFQQFPIVYIGRGVGAESAAYFVAMMQVIAISGSFLLIFTQPLIPAISDAFNRDDYQWIFRTYKYAVIRLVSYTALAAICIVIIGPKILELLMRKEVIISLEAQYFWAAFFFIVTWEHIGYIFLVGVGKLWTATFLYLLGAVIALISIFILFPLYGISGVMAALCFGPIFSTAVAYPVLINKFFIEKIRGVS